MMFTTVVHSAGSPHEMDQPQPRSTELLPLRVRLTCVGTIDEEIEREIINKGGQTT